MAKRSDQKGDEIENAQRRQPDCSVIVDLIPAYSIDAVDPEERILVDASLSRCPEAAAALIEYARLAEQLHYAITPHRPPPLLGTKLKDIVQTRPPPAIQPQKHAYQTGRWDRFRRQWRWQNVAVLALLCLVATNLYWLKYVLDLDTAQRHVAETLDAQGAVLAFLGSGKMQRVALLPLQTSAPDNTTPTALLVCDPEGTVGLLHVEHFPVSTSGYRLWFWQGQQLVKIISFDVTVQGTADVVFRAPEHIADYSRAAIDLAMDKGNTLSTTLLVAGDLYPDQSTPPPLAK